LPWIDEFALHEFGNEFEVHAPLLSLPGILGTSPETIPHQESYLFPPKDLVAVWSQRLRHHDGFRVGIVWRGNPGHKGDILRSTALDQFAPLAEIPGVRLLSLQHGTVPEQQDFPVDFLSDDLDEQAGAFLGLSAVLANIDLLITVDSAPAHVAGALGLPVWVALSKSPDWRWGLRGEKTDWYPSMRLFRQETAGDWSQVFRHMATKLHRQISEAGDHPSKPRTLPARHLQSFPRIHDQVHGRYGPILFNRKDAYIGKSLALYGDFSEGECDVFHQLISSGETLIEVGANIGALTVPLARFVGPKGRVIAFEPQRILYQVLCGNIAQNQLTNVEAYQKGCGAARGQMKVPPLDYTRRNNY
ncbi:MAG: FkbM family methyltransferase, partial [Verrucomicrobiota bacterium]